MEKHNMDIDKQLAIDNKKRKKLNNSLRTIAFLKTLMQLPWRLLNIDNQPLKLQCSCILIGSGIHCFGNYFQM